jgi:hypothetical protein
VPRCFLAVADTAHIFSGNISPIGELKVLVRLRSATIGERKAIKTGGVAVAPKKRHTYSMDTTDLILLAIAAYALWIGIGLGTMKEKIETFIVLSILIFIGVSFLIFIAS